MRRGIVWTVTLLAALAVHLCIGPAPLAAACPPTPECPCP
jgi:hypothetical protein